RRRRPQALRPILPHQRVIGTDAAGRNDDRLGATFEGADDVARTLAAALDGAWRENFAAHATDHWARPDERVDSVAELEGDEPSLFAFAPPGHEGRKNPRPGAPGEMKARHRIAVPGGVAAAALGPADHGEKAEAASVQPGALLARGEGHIGLGP